VTPRNNFKYSVDFEYARLLNATIKLLGMAQLAPDGSKVRPVHLSFFPYNHQTGFLTISL
jgi:hypothetical protein